MAISVESVNFPPLHYFQNRDFYHFTDLCGPFFCSFNVFRSNPVPLPHTVTIMERHPIGSQAFIAMAQQPFLVLVAPPGDNVHADQLRLFITDGHQGVNLFKNTWHHYQLVLGDPTDFIVIDRGGPGNNLEEREIQGSAVIRREDIG